MAIIIFKTYYKTDISAKQDFDLSNNMWSATHHLLKMSNKLIKGLFLAFAFATVHLFYPASISKIINLKSCFTTIFLQECFTKYLQQYQDHKDKEKQSYARRSKVNKSTHDAISSVLSIKCLHGWKVIF